VRSSVAAFDAQVLAIKLPKKSAKLGKQLAAALTEAMASMREVLDRYKDKAEETRIADDLAARNARKISKNQELLSALMTAAQNKAHGAYSKAMERLVKSGNPLASVPLAALGVEARSEALAMWNAEAQLATEETSFKQFEGSLENDMTNLNKAFSARNDKHVQELCEGVLTTLSGNMRARIGGQPLPMEAVAIFLSHKHTQPSTHTHTHTHQHNTHTHTYTYTHTHTHAPKADVSAAVEVFASAARGEFKRQLEPYTGLPGLTACGVKLEDRIQKSHQKLEQMNIDALTEKVEKPLSRAARRVQDISQGFWFVRSFRAEARRIAREEIQDRISPDLQDRVIYEWSVKRTKGGIGHLEPWPLAFYVLTSCIALVVLLVLWRTWSTKAPIRSGSASRPPPYSAPLGPRGGGSFVSGRRWG
jgi:hypothetical protein